MATGSTVESEAPVMDRAFLDEMVHWVKTLKEVGVSADKAAEVSKDLFVAALSGDSAIEEYEDDEDYEEEN